eukprot:3567809-Amphidinium_carterae.1
MGCARATLMTFKSRVARYCSTPSTLQHTSNLDAVEGPLLQEWLRTSKRQLVEAEILPVLLARRVWRARLTMRRLLIFVYSEPAKFSLLAGSSNTEACDYIVRAVALEECASPTWTWLSRVPIESNPTDEPSRLK